MLAYQQGTEYALHFSRLSKILFVCIKLYNSKATRKSIRRYYGLFMKTSGTCYVANIRAAMLLQEQHDVEERGCSRAAFASCVRTAGPLGVCDSRAGQLASPTSVLVGKCGKIRSRPARMVTMLARVKLCFRVGGELCVSTLCCDAA